MNEWKKDGANVEPLKKDGANDEPMKKDGANVERMRKNIDNIDLSTILTYPHYQTFHSILFFDGSIDPWSCF